MVKTKNNGFLCLRGILKRPLLASLFAMLMLVTAGAHAGFTSGGFENDFDGWTKRAWLWSTGVIPVFPPTTAGNLGLSPASHDYTSVVGAGTDASTNNNVGYPLFHNKAARVNFGTPSGTHTSSIEQTATMTAADIDPSTGKVHVRFAIAPVLENPLHPDNQQPYFFVEVTNVTKGTQLFQTFNFSGQHGVPWINGVGSWQYTQWQAIDIAPGPGVLDVGDQVKVEIYASRCGQTGHAGHVYVDSGPALTTLPGPYIYATAPQYASAGGPLTYTYTFGNTGESPLTGTTVVINPPAAVNGNLTTPVVSGDNGACAVAGSQVTCDFGTYNPNNVGSFQVTWAIPGGAIGPINHGNYLINGDNSPSILGPLVQTNLGATASQVDLGVTIDDGNSSASWGDELTYTITVTNHGPSETPAGATIVQNLPASLAGASWTCVASAGTSCPNASGSGVINETTTDPIPVGETLTYTLTATATGSGSGSINTSVTVTAPGSVTDTTASNNTAADVNNVGDALATLQVTKAGAGVGTVTSVAAGINCGTACTDDAEDFPAGSQVILYASAPSGSIFGGWSGGGCDGITTSSCTVTLGASGSLTDVTATFVDPLEVTPAVIGGNGTVGPSSPQPVAPNGHTSFTVTPNPGYAVEVDDQCGPGGASSGGSFVGNVYTTGPVAQDCTVNFSFTNVPADVVDVTVTVGANGSITPPGNRTVTNGGSLSWTVIPNSGYSPQVGGTCPAGSWNGSVYEVAPIDDDCSVAFTFHRIEARNDTAPAGTRQLAPLSNDATDSTFDLATLDLDPATAGIQTEMTTAQGTWRIVDAGTGTVAFEPAVGFYGSASLQYAITDNAGFTDTATMTVPIDPSGVVYDSATRLALAGAVVTISYDGSDGVVGDFLTSPVSVTTDSLGRYAFWLTGAPTGTFHLSVSLGGYQFVSTVIAPEAGDWPAGGGSIGTVGAPQGGDPTTYYLSGPIPTTDVTNNNIPLDAAAVPAAPVAVPTLGEWAMLLLALGLFAIGARRLPRFGH